MNRKINVLLLNVLAWVGGITTFIIALTNQQLSLSFFFVYFGFYYLFLPKRILALIPTYKSVRKKLFSGPNARFQDQEYEPLIRATVAKKILLVQGIGIGLLLIGMIFSFIF